MTDQEFEVIANRYEALRRDNARTRPYINFRNARTRPCINFHMQEETARRLTPHLLRVIKEPVTVTDFDLVCIP
jgi:hypothetical protein